MAESDVIEFADNRVLAMILMITNTLNNCISYSFHCSTQRPNKKPCKGGKACFGSVFERTTHNIRKVWQWGAMAHIGWIRKQQRGNCNTQLGVSSYHFYSVQNLSLWESTAQIQSASFNPI